MHHIYLLYLLGSLISFQLLRYVINCSNSFFMPCRRIPGPFVARFTRLWYFYIVWTGHAERTIMRLHRKHARPGQYFAPVVRLGPNMFSIVSPDDGLYNIRSKMPKTAWYDGWKHPSPDRFTLFTDRDIKRHAESRRKFSAIYAMSALVSYEGYVDECGNEFLARMYDVAKSGCAVDMAHWFQCYAFDVIGQITFGKRFGFLDEGKDIQDTMKALDRSMVCM